MEDYTRREQLKLVIRTNTTNAFSALGTAYSLYIDNKSICIILNTGLSDTLSKELFQTVHRTEETDEADSQCLSAVFHRHLLRDGTGSVAGMATGTAQFYLHGCGCR